MLPQFQRGQCFRLKGNSVEAVFAEPHGNLMAAKVNQLLRPELIPELLPHDFGVRVSDVEADQGADVSKNGLLNRRRKLVNELVGEGEAKPVFARFGKQGHERFS